MHDHDVTHSVLQVISNVLRHTCDCSCIIHTSMETCGWIGMIDHFQNYVKCNYSSKLGFVHKVPITDGWNEAVWNVKIASYIWSGWPEAVCRKYMVDFPGHLSNGSLGVHGPRLKVQTLLRQIARNICCLVLMTRYTLHVHHYCTVSFITIN